MGSLEPEGIAPRGYIYSRFWGLWPPGPVTGCDKCEYFSTEIIRCAVYSPANKLEWGLMWSVRVCGANLQVLWLPIPGTLWRPKEFQFAYIRC